MKTHILQSHTWEKYAQLEGHQTFWLEGKDFQALAIKYHTILGDYLYCMYGPTLFSDDPITSLEHSITALRKLAVAEKAFFVRIEPTTPIDATTMQNHGLVKSHDLDPAHTWVLDLTQPQEKLIADIEKEKMRKWRNYTKKNISVRTTKDPDEINIMSDLLNKLGEKRHFTPQDENHLRNQLKGGFATLYIAELEGQPIAANLIYDHDGVRYAAHAAVDQDHVKLNAGAILSVQTIIDAQNNGAHTFDFWGITDSTDPNHPWYGFTQYKKSFGGKQVDYAGTWDLPVQRTKYRFYSLIRQINRAIRKQKV